MDGSSDFAALVENRWDESQAGGMSAEQLLLYRSNLLGGDKRVTNYAGGNTSAKIAMADPLTGAQVSVLWVKGSGGDLGSMKLDGFATLYMEKLLALLKIYKGPDREDEMVGLYPHCTFNLNPRAASIDTPLHAFIDRPHVDHMHPDSVIAIAATADSEKLTNEIFGDAIGWLPWRRPGFELGMMLKRFTEKNPKAKGVILEAHGLFTWGDSSRACYDETIAAINKATEWLAEKSRGKRVFGGVKVPAADIDRRHDVAAVLMPRIRGMISARTSKVGHFEDSAAVLDYVGGGDLAPLAALGTSCPDHFLRTKIRPLVLPFDPACETVEDLVPRIAPAVEAYRADYTAYYERCKRPDSPGLRDPNAVVYLDESMAKIIDERGDTCKNTIDPWYPDLMPALENALDHQMQFLAKSGLLQRIQIIVVDTGPTGEPIYPANYQLGRNEPNNTFWCYSRNAQIDFRRGMKEKYATLAALNAAWNANYAAWDDIVVPKPPAAKGKHWEDVLLWYRDTKDRFVAAQVRNFKNVVSRYSNGRISLMLYVPGWQVRPIEMTDAISTGDGCNSVKIMADSGPLPVSRYARTSGSSTPAPPIVPRWLILCG